MSFDTLKIQATGLSTVAIEAKAIAELQEKINTTFIESCLAVLNCEGRVVVMGIGKSGHIGRKIAATLSSTGSPAFFLHPAEASHGDLGMITAKDLVIVLSYSGEASEIVTIVPHIKRLSVKIIALTGDPQSTIANIADITVDVGVRQEACPLGLAPTASTTAMLAMGDAIALAVLEARGFTADDFAKSHPGGKLGRRLLKIEEIMHTGHNIPRIQEGSMIIDALPEMSAKRLGFTAIVDAKDADRMMGIFTDGDLRRALSRDLNVHKTCINEVMTKKFTTVSQHLLASEAIAIMEKLKTLVMPVINEQGKLVGAFNMHDLFKAGVV